MTTILHPHACSYKLVPITLRIWLIIFSATISWPTVKSEENWNCQNGQGNDKCLCYTLDDGVFVECPGATAYEISNALKKFTTSIHSLSIYDLNEDIELLGPNIIPQGTCAKHVHISQTNVRDLDDDIFVPLRKCLETLSIESSRIKYIPQKAFTGLSKLISLDLKANAIEDVPSYSFYGLPLMRLNLRTNNIRDVSEAAFSSLEKFLSEIDFGENALEVFPMSSVQKLRHLRSLRLAFNDISEIPDVENSGLVSLEFLDLSYNNFEYIAEEYLKFCPSLKTLSLRNNLLVDIHTRAFSDLLNLESINLSHNKIKHLKPSIFQQNIRLKTVDLGYNHLHHIHGLFCSLPSLREVVLTHNNILDVPIEAFFNSSNVRVLHLDSNCISNIHSESFYNLVNLTEMHLEYNFLSKVPQDLLINKVELILMRLDNNLFVELDNDIFEYLVNVRQVIMNDNRLNFVSKHIFKNTIEVEEIHLQRNEIVSIDPGAFSKLKHLKHLMLQENYIINLDEVLPTLASSLISLHVNSNRMSVLKNYIFDNQINMQVLLLNNNNFKFISIASLGNLTSLKHITANHNHLSFIDDYSFRYLNSVKTMDISYNLMSNITNLTFYGLSELEELNLSYNKISYISSMSFDPLKKLRNLHLSFNRLKILHKNLFQVGLPLRSLNLDSNEIDFIENGTFRGLNNLKSLSLRNNSITAGNLSSIDVAGLKDLYLSYNVLSSLRSSSFSNFPLLEVLHLEHCNIDYMLYGTFASNKHLVKLNLAQNIINTIPNNLFDSLNSMLEFNISNNFLDYVPFSALYNFTNLEILDVSDNLLQRLEISGLEHLKTLKNLIFRKNEIEIISIGKKVELFSVVAFDLSFNHLQSLPDNIFETFPRLQKFNLSNNNIIQFDFFPSYNKKGEFLVTVDISNNPINFWTINKSDSKIKLISTLYDLYVGGTNLSNVDETIFDSFVNLRQLYLKFNKIRRLSISPFIRLSSLEVLDISYNRILHLKTSHFRGLIKLKTLCLSNNLIESIESFSIELRSLKLLDLSYNKLQNILNEDMANLAELTILNLSHNNIKYLSATTFKHVNKIKEINLSHNKLDKISLELLNTIEAQVEQIHFEGNMIVCSCEKNNTWTWIQDHPRTIRASIITCLNREFVKEKCILPTISQLSIDKNKDNSVSVSWMIRNRTVIKALQLIYYEDRSNSQVKTKYLKTNEASAQITELKSNLNYVLCVIALYNEPLNYEEFNYDSHNETINDNVNYYLNISHEDLAELLQEAPSNECVLFNTKRNSLTGNKVRDKYNIATILTRRLGLMVGCGLGCVVFFVMVSVLLYTKIQERRRITKSDPGWSEMTNYHSVLHSKEDMLENHDAASTDNILLGMGKCLK